MKQIKIILIISIQFYRLYQNRVLFTFWEMDCKKKVDWNNPGFTVVRTIITNGANAGN